MIPIKIKHSMNPAFLAMRVWRRFARLPFIEKPVIVGKDRFRALSFWARGINLDLLFIDGDHNYDGVKQDFLKYRHLVREGGLIVFHDIVPDYLTRYGIQTNRWVGGVPLFWSKIKLFYPFYEFVEEPEPDGLGIGAIRYYSHIPIPDDL